jgi:tetratricopeptide (TPR) repeat protein
MRLLDYGSVASELVVLYSTQQDLAAAAAWNAKDRAALEAAGLDRSEGMAFSLMNRSQILGDAGQWLEALATQREVMARFEAHLPEAELHPRVVSWLARCLAEVGAYDAAHARFAQAEARARAAENWAALAPVYVERASVELQRGNLAEAERAIAAGRALIAGDPVANRAGAHSLQVAHASLALARGDLATARGALDELFAELPEPQWRTTRGASRALVVASAVALAGGDVAQARTRAEQALRVASAVAVDEARSADVGDAWLALARAEQRAGRVDALQSAARRAEAALRLGRGPEHPATRAASALLGH